MPDWCLEYLARVAADLNMLASLRDTTTYPHRLPDESSETYQQKIAEWDKTSTITAETARDLVPKMLGLARDQKWNAFTDYHSSRQRSIEAMLYEADLSRGDPAVENLKARLNVDTKRTVRRHVEEGQRILHPDRIKKRTDS